MLTKIKMIYKWILVSIVFQLVLLTYVNNVYLPGRQSSIQVIKYGETAAQKTIMPSGVKDISLSYDGHYVGFLQKNDLKIVQADSGKTVKSFSVPNRSISFYKWLYDRNILLYSYSEDYARPGYVQILSYDLDTGIERSYPEMSLPTGSSIEDIDLSPLTNVVYTKIKVSDYYSRIYKYNIMNNLSFIMSTGIDTNIGETKYSDKLIYQDSSDIIYVRDGTTGNTESLNFNSKAVLLGIDSNDNIYAGLINSGGKVTSISYGKSDTSPEQSWTKIDLSAETSPKNIKITSSGKVILVNSDLKYFYEAKAEKQTGYKGTFIEALDSFAAFNKSGQLKLIAY